MPKRVEYFNENEVAFYVCLGEPTGGATLSTAEAMIVLQNDIGEYLVETPNRCFTRFSWIKGEIEMYSKSLPALTSTSQKMHTQRQF